VYHDSLKRDRACGERGRARRRLVVSSTRRLVSLAHRRDHIGNLLESFGGNETGPLSKPKSALRTATPRSRSVSRARRSVGPLHAAVPHRRACLAISRSRRVSTASPRFASAQPATDLADSRHMMAFRSRKRKAGAARETQAAKPPADAAATTPTGSPCKHPVAAFANTVYVDPVIKVRRRARVPSANCARDRKRASRAPYTESKYDPIRFPIPAAADPPRETPNNRHTARACIGTWIRRRS
jgi:hypothetical protein